VSSDRLAANVNKILIVDDDRITNATLAAMLKAGGYAVVSAYDAMTGFSTAIRERPDLVVMDLSMPAGGGFSVLERMKKIPALSNTPTIVVTSSDERVSRERATAIGAVAYLIKPVNADELRGIVAASLPGA
jgi:DNA-binding response OmpR family regulator